MSLPLSKKDQLLAFAMSRSDLQLCTKKNEDKSAPQNAVANGCHRGGNFQKHRVLDCTLRRRQTPTSVIFQLRTLPLIDLFLCFIFTQPIFPFPLLERTKKTSEPRRWRAIKRRLTDREEKTSRNTKNISRIPSPSYGFQVQLKEPVLKGKGCRWGGKRYQNDKQTAREVGNGSDRSPIARLLIYHWLDSTRTRVACRREPRAKNIKRVQPPML